MEIDDQAFAKTLLFNGMIGLGYYVVCSRYKLLSEEVLKSQGAMFALSTTIHTLLQPSQPKKELTFTDVIPLALITLTKAWTDITWKAQLLSTAILGGAQILISKSPIRHNTSSGGSKPPKDPIPLPPKVDPINCSKDFGKTTVVIQTEDILLLEVEAIVNAAKTSIEGGGGIDGIIHGAAGPELKEECIAIKKARGISAIKTGEAVITDSYNIQQLNPQIKYVVHTPGPTGGTPGRAKLLADSYRNCLIEATKKGIRSIAFPGISVGLYGYPTQEGINIGFETVKKYVEEHQDQFDTIIFAYLPSDTGNLLAAGKAWESIIEAD